VIEALKKSNLVILQYHGVVLTADRFEEGLSLIESLEQAVRVAAIARLFNKKDLDKLDKSLKQNLTKRVVRLSSQSRSVTRGNIQWL
jgi:ribulose-5-phosphate 4-epimerase/fuculose-1-phosphate aldolase